ncbi:hypothetical protein GCM10010231_16250 [Streptomyces sindenensis]|nr:hypothetical protein GCM10010231_16250 [Streptomyces sindenensis]
MPGARPGADGVAVAVDVVVTVAVVDVVVDVVVVVVVVVARMVHLGGKRRPAARCWGSREWAVHRPPALRPPPQEAPCPYVSIRTPRSPALAPGGADPSSPPLPSPRSPG